MSDGLATAISCFFTHLESLCTHFYVRRLSPTCHAPSSSTGSATGAGDGPTLANGHTAVKLPAMKAPGLKEKYKVPFETEHVRSSQQRRQQQQQQSGGSTSV